MALSRPTHQRVTHTVGRLKVNLSQSLSHTMMWKKASVIFLSLLIIVIYTSLAYLWFSTRIPRHEEHPSIALKTNHQKWHTQNVSHYQFTLEVGCLCFMAGPLKVEVNNGQVVVITDQTGKSVEIIDDPDAGVDNINFYASFITIERMFNYAENAVARGDDFSADYDSRFGFPTRMCLYNCGHLTPPEEDGYIAFRVSNFAPLP
jgi:hypothetical protein